ncbi:histone deacetylase complex subunit Cti6 [Schizosaccharomyces cryophilus OY26]|uniref:Histone deacetylase complex subunit Cti6 n=1 Tax=Schizosaccharomyces cryophilus (strain OY26 / ATCC MYA-4695 / CBS 11777 / NBRC 106824 / NRRL Y48691) TaxID=653667 RepID=S9VW93_SCHCR|nr:histone deacetylase complex subunit Cti6 [Schizosaccharomyces cryophilus OY26]EPY50509.1 histone deacetylase complex subunit Cti6 [Schizosaccharomyces cryophilus OY26]
MPRTSSKKAEENKEKKTNSKNEERNSVNATNGSISEEENESSKGSEITRCVCGIEDNDDDSSDGGLYIQCDQCSVWQHGHCVGFQKESDVPDVYYCEICRPELHKIYQRGRGPKQSKYLGLIAEQKPPQSESPPASPPSPVVKKQVPKQRLTMNSRDAALDYEEYLAIAKEQSLLTRRSRGPTLSKSASPPVQASVSGEALPTTMSPEEQEEEQKQEQEQEQEQERERQQEREREREQEQERGREREQEQEQEETKKEEEKAHEARQELEPEKNSKEESIPIDTVSNEERVDEEENPEAHQVKEEAESALPSPSSVQSTPVSSSTGRGGGRRSKREAPVDNEKGSLSPSTAGQRGSKSRKTSSRRGKSSALSANTHRSGSNHVEGEHTTETNTKHKGLHPRITITEMRRRVATMLEYIGHIQVEMASQSANSVSGSQVTKEIPEDEKETLRQVDNLTRELLHWEQRFGKT